MLKLNIQKFSGGSYDYISDKLDMYCQNNMHDIELNDLIDNLIKVLHDLEWWQSGDTCEKDYRDTVKQFKEKWFKTDRTERLKMYIDKKFEDSKKELYALITDTTWEDESEVN